MPTIRRTFSVTILVFDEVEALDFAGPYEVFTTASRVWARSHPDTPPLFQVQSVARDNTPVRARAGLRLLPDATFDTAPQADVLIVPGGVVDAPMACPHTLAWVIGQHQGSQITASVCTGAFVLAASCVLTHERVTTHWEDLADLQAHFPALQVVPDVRWVDNGHTVTSAGISAGIDMCLHLVGRLVGTELAQRTAHQMDYSWTA
jgi:transcriptional regulator GlxA family with amidase domain